MRIYTEFIIAKEAEKGKSRNEFHCGFSLLRDMRDERIANLLYSRPWSRMMTIRIGSTHWK